MKARSLWFVGVFLLAACSPNVKKNSSAEPKPDPIIIEKLQEIVEIRERESKEQQLLIDLGRGGNSGSVEIALAEARIELARESGQPELVIEELRKLVKVCRANWERANALAVEDRATSSELVPLKVFLLEAEVRLQREIASRLER